MSYRKTGYKRVYIKSGAYYFVDRAGKWHRLCAESDGEPAMIRQLAKHRDAPDARPGSFAALIKLWREKRLPQYAEVSRYDYGLMLPRIEAAFQDIDVADLTSLHVMDLRDQWEDKPRTANKYVALVSVLCSFAIEKRMIGINPCRDVKKLDLKKRKVYQSDAVTVGMIENAKVGANKRKAANGEMYAALFSLAYLTALRAKDLRLLRWSDISDGFIHVEPTKTEESSGAKLAIKVTPAIQAVLDTVKGLGKVKSLYVFHTLKGGPFTASALKSAWRRARERTPGAAGARFRDLRPKALSDAKRRGKSLEALKDAAGHTSVTTTEDYLRGFEVVEADLDLALPASKTASK